MGVHVVRAVLGVVFQDENGGLRPELAVADRLDQRPKRQVVVGHVGGRRRHAGLVPDV